ncbi:ABC transporter permease [Actinoalloteichus hymeniacidonis]|uniref:ABC-2 family transporter protein n=1 Tax=Actinoalloteichus hymeniacidonis TaxID=340345 RepID=A0AAC9HTJ0_9PSEU|nr:hypothetical protein [Actinoalloteichus hymeniacidonis]AOS65299.1 ABC-2 family transporter protein [Actinoalloteichus hymeniacidonis]MBB5906616.1 ABC-type transport system involved in multi-copper enzyme maturation permease subunit [Actinoalloteichus hymeniacidonis]
MFWLVWRRNRVALISLVVLSGLIALAHFIVATRPSSVPSPPSHDLVGILGSFVRGISGLTPMLPGFMAALVGGTLLAKELNSGTHRFLFTQQNSRNRWFITGTATVLIAVAVMSVPLSLALTSVTDQISVDRGFGYFSQDILAMPATAVFVTSFAMLIGAATKREIVGVVSGPVIGWGTWLLFNNILRPTYATPLSTTDHPIRVDSDNDGFRETIDTSVWLVDQELRDIESKEVLSNAEMSQRYGEFYAENGTSAEFVPSDQGLEWVYHYHPYDRYWSFQFIETGILLGLTALCLGAAFWVVNRRTG